MQRIATTLTALVVLTAAAVAHDYTVGSLKIEHPWARATPKGAAVGGGYLTITNAGAAPDRLIGGSSEVAGKFEIHEMSMVGNVMKMRSLTGGLVINPGETVTLKPGGIHIMFVGLSAPLVEGQHIKGTLMFEKAGKVDVEYIVDKIGAQGSMGSMKH